MKGVMPLLAQISTIMISPSRTSNLATTLSIIIPTYNSSRYILKALESVFAQYRLPDEVIVIDNCSSDNTLKLVAEHYPSVKLIRNAENIGPYNNWISGIQEAKSEFFMLLFSDDILQPSHSSTLLTAQSRSGADIVIPNPRIYLEDSDSDFFNCSSIRKPGTEYSIPSKIFINLSILTNSFQISPCGILFHRRSFIQANLSRHSLPASFSQKYPQCLSNGAGIDHLLILNSAKQSSAIHIVDVPTLIFRQHKSSFSTSVSRTILSRLYASAKISFLTKYHFNYLLLSFYYCLRKASLESIWHDNSKHRLNIDLFLPIAAMMFYTIVVWSLIRCTLAKVLSDPKKLPITDA